MCNVYILDRLKSCRNAKIGRNHHLVCPAIKHAEPKPACANFKGVSCDACLIDVDDEEPVVFSEMAVVVQPECVETSSKVDHINRVCLFYNRCPQSAFDIATSYPELAKKLFPHGGAHPLVGIFFYYV